MEKTGVIGADLGKRSFQLRGVREDGTAAFRKIVHRLSMPAAPWAN